MWRIARHAIPTTTTPYYARIKYYRVLYVPSVGLSHYIDLSWISIYATYQYAYFFVILFL